MLEDDKGLNLGSLIDPSILQQRTTTLIKRKQIHYDGQTTQMS